MLLYIIVAIIIFGVLIAVHELGHFLFAKLFGVRVNEFAIGMGPALVQRTRGETTYALRAFPIGGYCAMEGEDGDSADPRAMSSQRMWKKLLILVAGALMNFVAGFLILLVLFSQVSAFYVPVIHTLEPDFPQEWQGEQGLMPGDRILEIDGERVYIYNDLSILLNRGDGKGFDLVLERKGEKVVLEDFPLTPLEYGEGEEKTLRYGINFSVEEATPFTKLQRAWDNSLDFVRLVRMSLVDLITGRAGVDQVSGPIGIVTAISNMGTQAESTQDAAMNIAYFAALIAINLAVMNLLPIPALDGGRIFFLVVTGIITAVTKKRVDPKYEGYIHFVGLVCLMGLMVLVAFNDVAKIVIS